MLAWGVVVGMAFVPTFLVALVMLRSVWRAFVLAAAFTGGAFAAFIGCAFVGSWLLRPQMGQESEPLVWAFATAGAIGGGVLALYVLGRFSRYPPWRRY